MIVFLCTFAIYVQMCKIFIQDEFGFFMFKLPDRYICPTSFIVCCVRLIGKYLPFSVHMFNKVF